MVDPFLVAPDGPAASPDSDDHEASGESGAGLLRWMAAALIGIIATGTLLLVGEGGGGLTPLSHEGLIQAHLDAWYGGDYDTARSLRAPERLRTGPPEERARAEVEYQAILEARADVLECEELPPATIRCDVAYSSVLNETVETAPAIVAQQFGIRDGLILFVAGPYLEDVELTTSFRDFATRQFPSDYEGACVEEPNYQSPGCALFKLLHLRAWAGWHVANGPGIAILGLDNPH